jgi:glycosyltransferase involved in cell wall biosynthesis
MTKTTPLIRPEWNYKELHQETWKNKEVTIVMCERDTADVTKLGIESILRFYPDIPIVIVDGGSVDDSINYVRYLDVAHENVTLWERYGRNGHGTMLDDAILKFVKTKYVLVMDNDIIVRRGGWIEQMLITMNVSGALDQEIYALGSLMLVTYKGDGCGDPVDDSDVLRYTHPSCAMVRLETYLQLPAFVEHGAPLVYNMKAAQDKGYRIEYFPIEEYVTHLSGASWTNPYRTMWKDDQDVFIRPFFTFIARDVNDLILLQRQNDKDFEILLAGTRGYAQIHVFNIGQKDVSNDLYPLRFHVHGEYICELGRLSYAFDDNHLTNLKYQLIQNKLPDEMDINGMKFIKRKLWQSREAIS